MSHFVSLIVNATTNKPRVSDLLGEHLRPYKDEYTRIAGLSDISPRQVELALLLHLPRMMTGLAPPNVKDTRTEVERLAARLATRCKDFKTSLAAPADVPSNPTASKFVQVSDSEAQIIHERFHYLQSFRPRGQHFGLVTQASNRLFAVATLSVFDLWHLAALIRDQFAPREILVISRVFCFDWAPRNSISYLLGRIARWLRKRSATAKLLLTYVNPNMGFRGASYRAANWYLLAREWGTRYCYIDEDYITDRHLALQFGTIKASLLSARLGSRFATTQIELEPLMLYAYLLHRSASLVGSHSPIDCWRPLD